MKYAWIKSHQNEFSVIAMCRFLKVSRSGYYDWLKRPKSNREMENERLTHRLKELFQEGRGIYGTRRLKKRFADLGDTLSRRRIGRLMKRAGLICQSKRKFKVTTDSKHHQPIAPNLLERRFNVDKPDQYYVGDITYIETRQGWLYLAVVIDLYSRHVVGWSMDQRMTAQLVNDALLMAIWKRKPAKGLIWHTDRGSQYASDNHRKILKQHGIEQSMSRKGDCWDNAVCESFFHTLKTELVHHFDLGVFINLCQFYILPKGGLTYAEQTIQL